MDTGAVKKRARLYFFHHLECDGCKALMPEVKAFESANADVEVIYWDVVDRPWTLRIKPPDATPALLCLDAKGVRTLTAFVLPADAIARWVRRESMGDTIQ